MKILQLDLIAFGPFSNICLDLSEGREGLHLIYGPNEAGKSSALRAIRNLLYGIPERTLDDFLHPYGKLRVGGILRNSTGSILGCIRRKGRSNTLRGPDDAAVLDESVLRGFLGGVDEEDFSKRFGINHETLVRGGREIVEGGGELASVLFAAGSGIANFRAIQEGFKSEMDALFKPNASKPTINEVLARLKEEQKKLRQAQLPGNQWAEHDTALRDALEWKRQVQVQLEQKEQERGRLGRILKALPAIGRRKPLLKELEPYSDAVILPHEFSEKRQEALTALLVEQHNQSQATENLVKTEKELEGLGVPSPLLEHAGEIERLHLELGSISKAAADRPGLVLQKDLHLDEARQILGDLRQGFPLEEVEKLRLETATQVLIRKLGETREKFVTRLESAHEKIEELSRSIGELEGQFLEREEQPDLSWLKLAIEEAKRQGKIEEELSCTRVEILKLAKDASAGIKTLGLWTGTIEELENLPVPDLETINDFDSSIRDAEAEVKKQESEIERLRDELLEIWREIEKLRMEQDVPTENDLMLARQRRDKGWKIIRRLIDGGGRSQTYEDEFIRDVPGAEDLPGAFERSIQAADETVDRLRREVGRVEHYARLISDREIREANVNRVQANRERAESGLAIANEEWTRLWAASAIRPDSPGQMRRWADRHRKLSETSAKIRDLELKANSKVAAIKTLREDLLARLAEVGRGCDEGESLSRLITRGEQVFNEFEKTGAERHQLERDLAKKCQELRAAEVQEEKAKCDLNEWQDKWEEAIQPLGLGRESIPDQANAILTQLQGLFVKLGLAKEFRTRIEQVDADAAEFEKKVREILKALAPDLAELPAEQAVLTLSRKLDQAKTAKTLRESLEERLRDEDKKKEDAAQEIARLTVILKVMCEEARCSRFDELQEAEKRSDAKRELKRQLEEVEQRLFDLASGMAVEDFIVAAELENPDSIKPRLHLLEEEIAALTEKKSELDQAIGEERNELSRMDGRAEAAEIAQDIQMCLGELGGLVRSYSRLKIASMILSEAMESYREKNQGPVLRRASEFFSTMTLGSFEALQVDTDEKENSVIEGLRAGGKELVKVDGLSDGTADQLYLSLRLASVEHYLDSNEPLPFIADDILVRFDNERAAATLKIMATLSERTQVIFFTHHVHLVETAKSAVGQDRLFIHKIGT